ncbi:MAG: HEAT repeat domain-containing protein [Pirellula sp.]
MDDLNRKPRRDKLNRLHLFPMAIAMVAWSLLLSSAMAQEPRKPSWIPFPMGRTSGNFAPIQPNGNPNGNPNSKSEAPPIDPPNPSLARPTSPPEAWLMWADPLAPNTQQPGDCCFRRTMDLPELERCFVDIDCETRTEVFLNGQRVRPAKPTTGKQRIDLQSVVRPGQNVLALAVQAPGMSTPGVRVEFYFKPKQGNWRMVVSDAEWKASKGAPRNWQTMGFNDGSWAEAVDLSPSTAVAPMASTAAREPSSRDSAIRDSAIRDSAGRSEAPDQLPLSAQQVAQRKNPLEERFNIVPGFSIEEVADAKIGSLVAMTFNEFGHIIASVEGGGLVLMYDTNKDGVPDTTKPYCDLVENVQGLLALNGDVYVTGEGPDGSGLYRLIDSDRNGELEKCETLAKFKGTPGEHGAHQIAFGPDGCLYLSIGNHAGLAEAPAGYQPLMAPYEGDLIRPRFEDPGGHAMGIKAPGGTVVRYDLSQRTMSVVAGGLRNAYDLTFHPDGSMFLHDSDMEADIGSAWHRATGLFKVVEGGEFGWRSGWANWPEYYPDRLGSLANTGRGSPTGITIYNHFAFPARYHRAIFTADWSEGRIVAVQVDTLDRGKVRAEDFVVGTPMNVTDVEIGPDGALYFCCGGRGTEGGIYRVRWQGKIPDAIRNLGDGIAKAIRQPQLYSAYSRQAVAIIKREIGEVWDEQVLGVAFSEENPARYRTQALDLMQLLGPLPTPEVLVELSKTPNDQVRSKTARLMGLHASDTSALARLRELLGDESPEVRLACCEALVRSGQACEPSEIRPLLLSDSREERFLGRRLLMNIPTNQWRSFLTDNNSKVVIQSALALVHRDRDPTTCSQVMDHLMRVSKGFVSDADFLDLLRTMQVALHVSGAKGVDYPEVGAFVAQEFPTGNSTINGELVRLATFAQVDLVADAVAYLKTDATMADRMLIAMHLPMMPHEWTSSERMATLQFLEGCLGDQTGGSYALYVMKTSESLANYLTEREALQILDLGERYPNAAMAALYKLPEQLSPDQIDKLKRLDSAIDQGGLEADVYKRLKTGITAVLSMQTDESAMEHLRERWRKSPDRRATIALAMSQKPNEANWDYLVRSMGLLDLFAVGDVCNCLLKIDAATEDAEALRQAILQGCKLVEAGQDPGPVIKLLEYWTATSTTSLLEQTPANPEEPANPEDNEEAVNVAETATEASKEALTPIAAWQRWYATTYPDAPPAVLASETADPRWSLEFIEQFLNGEQGRQGSTERGQKLYAKARCNACHKMNGEGGGYGPDLSSLKGRFTRIETLESILFPSHVISDQYATKKVLTKDGEVYTGILVKTPKGLAVRVNENKEFVLAEDQIEEVQNSKTSVMPAGLLDNLTPSEIRDLMVYLGYVPAEKLAQEKPAAVRR